MPRVSQATLQYPDRPCREADSLCWVLVTRPPSSLSKLSVVCSLYTSSSWTYCKVAVPSERLGNKHAYDGLLLYNLKNGASVFRDQLAYFTAKVDAYLRDPVVKKSHIKFTNVKTTSERLSSLCLLSCSRQRRQRTSTVRSVPSCELPPSWRMWQSRQSARHVPRSCTTWVCSWSTRPPTRFLACGLTTC